MRPAQRTLTGDGASEQTSTPVRISRYAERGLSIAVDTDGSTTAATVEYTLDDIEFNDSPVWFDWTSIDAVTSNTHAYMDFPVEAVRLKLDANGTDTIRMRVVQGGGEGNVRG
jgi:hypothetical protein